MSAELKLELSAKIVYSGYVEMFSHSQTGYGVNP